MTKAKRWPNNAEWARMEAIALAERIAKTLRPVRDNTDKLSTIEIVRRTADAIDASQIIKQHLNAARNGEQK